MSVRSHLTSVRPENTFTYSAGNGGQNIYGFFSETAPLQRYTTSGIVWLSVQSAILETAHAVSIARAFSKIRTRVVPRVLHSSVFIHKFTSPCSCLGQL